MNYLGESREDKSLLKRKGVRSSLCSNFFTIENGTVTFILKFPYSPSWLDNYGPIVSKFAKFSELIHRIEFEKMILYLKMIF